MRPYYLLAATLTLPIAAQQTTSLPVTHVSLYKNGVGFFEHTGHVTGDASVTIDFTSSQLNDVLQSLTAIDLNGGRISGAGYNSTTPLEQQLKTLPLSLDANPTVADFYAAIRGARIEVRSGPAIISGRLLSIEINPTSGTPTDANAGHIVLTVVSDTGEVRTIALTQLTTVHLLDPALDADVGRYLKLLDSTRSQGLRHLTLEDHGSGSRELRVSYISEVPIWKSTYRILLSDKSPTATLQGWSVVDNTTGTDWINVHLSLIAGAPQSFIQPLSQPIYSQRPEIAIAQEAQLTPQTFASGEAQGAGGISGRVTDQSGALVANASVVITNMATGTQQSRTSDSAGHFSISLPAGQYKIQASAPGFQTFVETNLNVSGQMASITLPLHVGSVSETVEVTAASTTLDTQSASVAGYSALPLHKRSIANMAMLAPGVAPPPPPPPSYEESAVATFTANTQSNAFDDFFAYNLTEPVTIRKNESALVPILQAKVDADRVTLVHSDGRSTSQPLRALWITNSSGLTLDRGSFSIVEDGNFGGEGLLDPIHAGEKRLLSYAADQAVHISTENPATTNKVVRITAAKGVLSIHSAQHTEMTYAIHNAAADARTIVLEHPVQPGYALDPDARPEETTASVYRFRLTAAPNETVRLHVAANHQNATTYELSNADDDQFTVFLQQSNNNPKISAALAPIIAAQHHVTETSDAVDQTTTKLTNLHSTEERQRANITALQSADKSSRERFVRDLNHTEDEITATEKELETRNNAHDEAEAALSKLIESLQLDESI